MRFSIILYTSTKCLRNSSCRCIKCIIFYNELSICNLQPAELIKKLSGESIMKYHINGWTSIQQGLRNRNLAQRDLARWLGVSPSAVSQAKKEEIQFSLAQLAMICELLHFDAGEAGNLFSEVINARLIRSIRNYPAAKRIVKAKKEDFLTIHCQRND